MKSKLSVNDQINHLKNKKIQFNIMNEEQAINYLTYNTYYFKLKQYALAFEYNKSKHYYINLEFAYMVELYELDLYLKEFLAPFCILMENLLKTRLINDITNNLCEDEYSLVNLLYLKYPYIENNLKRRHPDIIHISIWELISFSTLGEFSRLFNLYYDLYPNNEIKTIRKLIRSLISIRNATAHDDPLLSNLRVIKDHYSNRSLYIFLSKITSISKKIRTTKMKNPLIYDLISILYLFNEICIDKKLKKRMYEKLMILLNTRMILNSQYFNQDNLLCSYYHFILKVVDYLYENSL